MLFHNWAFTSGIAAWIPVENVFQRPTSIPPPAGLPESWEGAGVGVSPSPPDAPPPPIIELMSKSMYITCFLMVLWYEPLPSTCGNRDA